LLAADHMISVVYGDQGYEKWLVSDAPTSSGSG